MPNSQSGNLPTVPAGLHWQARFYARTAPIWRWLSRLESGVLREEIERVAITRPIYIAGVPRAGSTLLTEFLSTHPAVTSHRYSDFPNVYTPYWRNWLAERTRTNPSEAVERAHGDRIMVTNESPEAVEEVIWMQFFASLHDPGVNQVLDKDTKAPDFERFYTDHVRKLLLARGRERYLAKGNYNASRLQYLLKLFPDARIVVPVRSPANQIASLIKQDRLFTRAAEQDPRIGPQLRMSGHFEFGPARCAVNTGCADEASRMVDCWQRGDLAAGWAIYWNSIYAHLLRQLEEDSALNDAVQLVRYETLCQHPDATLRELLDHTGLDPQAAKAVTADFSERISEPDYYRPDFSDEEMQQIDDATHSTARALGYRT
ncbi:MAG: sulfotransferase [Wenzhouxiangella sp.]|jgi:hypothetical protein|nr:sulfotransferase [Wenzhouxiangella sp.]